jgi:hypothetical protein
LTTSTNVTALCLRVSIRKQNEFMKLLNTNMWSQTAAMAVLMFSITAIDPRQSALSFESERANFSISFQGLTSDLSIQSTTLMPGTKLTIETSADATASKGVIAPDGKTWIWQAPSTPGLSVVSFAQGGDRIDLNIFVLTPWSNGKQSDLNGYKIGTYATKLHRGLSSYAAPTGFIEVTEDIINTRISPHFTLAQFLCKQQPGHKPTYVLIKPGMLMKLERLLEAANAQGWQAETFTVMSGFRTPYYNKVIGNKTTSSRHLYGGAADVFIDADGNGAMDDLTKDGKVDTSDAIALAHVAKQLSAVNAKDWGPGGIAAYSANSAHGPFVHVDVRGYKSRWGK